MAMAVAMALHHRREIDNMRSAYDSHRPEDSDNGSDTTSYRASHSGSDRSCRTAPTEYSGKSSQRPAQIRHNTCDGETRHAARGVDHGPPQEGPRASVQSYTSTIASEEDPAAEPLPDYDVPKYSAQHYGPAPIAATPADFSELFPSQRRLAIRHDDSTLDGNMNLRIDAEVHVQGQRREMTLFHLRMHDLRDREFSLRRYCRDSGREVCHSTRKLVHRPPPVQHQRPGFPRSLSSALSSMRSKSEHITPTLASLKRNDSGYGSLNSALDLGRDARPSSASAAPKAQQQASSNSMHLEFSNYAHVDLKRAGAKGSKRYEFEYWGTHYAWRRTVRKRGQGKLVAYELTTSAQDRPVAHIIPVPLTPAQVEEECRLGGWVPPSMWIADETIARGPKDVADVVLATGLLALVDDSIKSHFHVENSRQLLIPRLQMGVEYVGPKRLIREMFKRDASSHHSRRLSNSSRAASSAGAPGLGAVK